MWHIAMPVEEPSTASRTDIVRAEYPLSCEPFKNPLKNSEDLTRVCDPAFSRGSSSGEAAFSRNLSIRG